ncbi:MAG: folate family ECF transporter S component [Eubacteriales bacterium]|jgi:ECF transporter S component (folate family)
MEKNDNNKVIKSGGKVRTAASKTIAKITLTAMFLAFALVIKSLISINVPIFGGNGMKISFAGVFTFFPAALFGPIYGAIVSGLSEVLGYLIKPDGAYIPFLTFSAMLAGFVKGLIWKYVSVNSKSKVRARVILACCLILLGTFGVFNIVSLNRDGVMSGVIARKDNLPTRGKLSSMDISAQTGFISGLAQYNNDVITISNVTTDENTVSLPSAVIIDGHKTNITKLGPDAFASSSTLTEIFIPSTINKIDPSAFEAVDSKTVILKGESGSEIEKYASDNGFSFSVESGDPITIELSSDNLSDGIFTLSNPDTYRKYLAGYINFMCIGLIIVAGAGLIFVVADVLVSRFEKKKDENDSGRSSDAFKVFITIFSSGLLLTTINTEILRWYLTAWNGRSFLILWIPRAVEEMLVCMIQAYVISILYGVYKSRIEPNPRFRNLIK